MVHSRFAAKRLSAALSVIALVGVGQAAAAKPPVPIRSETADVFSGRWYEIARTPNKLQRECVRPITDFQGRGGVDLLVTETCHHPSDGAPHVVRAKARLLDPGQNTHFRMSFLGGLVHQDYWVLDHADDNAWMIMATPGGNYVWLLSRRPSLPAAVLATANAHVAALGFPLARLVYAGPGDAHGG